MRFGEILIEQRFRAEHAEIRQPASAEQYAICADETVISDAHRGRGLAIFLDVDAVGDDLRLKSGKGCELPDRYGIRAIDQVAVGDGRMFAEDQLRLPLFLLREVAGWAEWKTSDPIATANCGVSFQVKKINVLAHSEMIDAAAFFHDEARWKNPGKANPAA